MRVLLKEALKLFQGAAVSEAVKENYYKKIVNLYTQFDKNDKHDFIVSLAKSHNIHSLNEHQITALHQNLKHPDEHLRSVMHLRSHLTPAYRHLFLAFGRQLHGIKFLVDLRTDMLDLHHSYMDQLEKLASGPPSQAVSTDSTNPTLNALRYERDKLEIMSSELQDLLSIWFTPSMFCLDRVTWHSSCSLLQKIWSLEAVHRINSWQELKKRVGDYRRCFVLSHICMPKEPIVILHVALCPQIVATLAELNSHPLSLPAFTLTDEYFEENSAYSENTENLNGIKAAVFYSITSPHKGLSGIDLGQTMIRTAVKELKEEFPDISLFSTLSNVTGFRVWLLSGLKMQLNEVLQKMIGSSSDTSTPLGDVKEEHVAGVLEPQDIRYLRMHWGNSLSLKDSLIGLRNCLEDVFPISQTPSENLSRSLVDSDPAISIDFIPGTTTASSINYPFLHQSGTELVNSEAREMEQQDDRASELQTVLRPLLTQLCARFLCRVKHRGFVMDRVANFHLKNGAEIWRINWLGDPSERGMSLSYGFMVNYRYNPQRMDENQKCYMERQEIMISPMVQNLLEGNYPPTTLMSE